MILLSVLYTWLVLLLVCVYLYWKLSFVKNKTTEAWKELENQLNRRIDLVLKLAENPKEDLINKIEHLADLKTRITAAKSIQERKELEIYFSQKLAPYFKDKLKYDILQRELVEFSLAYFYWKLYPAKNNCETKWEELETQLNRRLLEPISQPARYGNQGYEKEEIEDIEELKNKIITAKSLRNREELETFINKGTLAYLKNKQQHITLKNDLLIVEERIGYTIKYYNQEVELYARCLNKFPYSLLKKLSRFTPAEPFEVVS
ncbi:MAG: LemA family protein [Elusimicrobiota bacterium]